MPDFSAISPGGSATGSLPRNWTWIWNCGENPVQYQDATAVQYQPSNVNVAIRISSPGNDGPVSQANLAVAAVAAAIAGPVAAAARPPKTQAPAPVLPAVLPAAGAVSDVVSALTDALPAVTAPLPVATAPVWLGGDTSLPSLVESIVDIVDLPHVLPLVPPVAPATIGERPWRIPGAAAGIRFARPVSAAPLELGTRAAQSGLSAVASEEASGPSAGSPSAGAAEKRAPRWRAPRPEPVPEPVPSGASIAPATGGGSSGGGIPIFLALPFLAAMLDLARRVTLDRVALPSGYRSRMPEDPG
jgi:hypothetical protein